MKIAIVADSNSGVTQDEVKKLGIYVLPMPFMIDGQVFYEGIDLSHEEFYRRMEEGADITTSHCSARCRPRRVSCAGRGSWPKP